MYIKSFSELKVETNIWQHAYFKMEVTSREEMYIDILIFVYGLMMI